jgi:hypothetical protein
MKETATEPMVEEKKKNKKKEEEVEERKKEKEREERIKENKREKKKREKEAEEWKKKKNDEDQQFVLSMQKLHPKVLSTHFVKEQGRVRVLLTVLQEQQFEPVDPLLLVLPKEATDGTLKLSSKVL